MTLVLPWSARRALYRRLLGWEIARSARIGLSFVDVEALTMGPGSAIGHLNVIRGLPTLSLGENAVIGQWNWITSSPRFSADAPGEGRFRGLVMETLSAVVSRHYLDCSGGITIGRSSVLAGVRSTLLTHQVDIAARHVVTSPISIGRECLVSSDVRFAPGSVVPDGSVIAMGAVVAGRLTTDGALYGGVPAKVVRQNFNPDRSLPREGRMIPLDPREMEGRATTSQG